jgi:hypothetical protein
MSKLWAFLRGHKDEIGAAVGLLGLVIGTLGFTMTWLQLSNTERTLRAANTYQVQKDGRELLDKIGDDDTFRSYLASDGSGTMDRNTSDSLWRVYNFYLSVYRQAKAGGLSDEFTESFRADFCQFVSRPAAKNGWEKLKSNNQLSPRHDRMRAEWCNNG